MRIVHHTNAQMIFCPAAILAAFVLLVPQTICFPPVSVRAESSPVIASPHGLPDCGVIYYIPGAEMPDDLVIRQLAQIREQGFRHINISSWVWTLPHPGSPLRRRADLILNWCDRNDLGVWLLHNIQYGTPEYGDFDQAIKDPAAYVRPVVVDWVDTLRGHPCVRGVQLGNEVGPAIPQDAGKAPLYVKAFGEWLRERYQTVERMNAAWGANNPSFEAVGLPAADTPGRIDLQEFADIQFGRFYGAIFNTLFKPVLGGGLGYTSKTGPDPYLYASYPAATVAGWDDMVANHPLWTLRVLTDCDPRPAFNDEMHLYHDAFAYSPSVELTRYRYFMDSLSGEWTSSSYAWGSWNKPEIAAIHASTRVVLSDEARLAPELRRFDEARRSARTGVLVTLPLLTLSSQPIAERPVLTPGVSKSTSVDQSGATPLEDAYAALGATGRPWRYVLDRDLHSQARQLDVLIVPGNDRIPNETVRQIAALPQRIRVIWAGDWPAKTEYGQPLPVDLLRSLQGRCHQNGDLAQVTGELADPLLPRFYREVTMVPYSWWSPKRGSFSFGVRYARVEARQVAGPHGSVLVALINNTRETVKLPDATILPWYKPGWRILDLMTQSAQEIPAVSSPSIVLKPFDVRLYRYEK